MIQTRISLTRGWGDRIARRIEAQVPRAMQQAAEDGAREASAASSSRRRTGKMAEMDVLPVERTPRGFTGGFRSKAWYAGLQSRGTKNVRGLGFLERGRTEMRKSLKTRLNRLT